MVTRNHIVAHFGRWQSDDGAAVVVDVLDEQRLVAERERGAGRGARLGRAGPGLAYLSAERSGPEPHPYTRGSYRRPHRGEGVARVRAPDRRLAAIAVYSALARLAVRWRPGHFGNRSEQAEARRALEVSGRAQLVIKPALHYLNSIIQVY